MRRGPLRTHVRNIVPNLSKIRHSGIIIPSDPNGLRIILEIRITVKLIMPTRVVDAGGRVEPLINVMVEMLESCSNDYAL